MERVRSLSVRALIARKLSIGNHWMADRVAARPGNTFNSYSRVYIRRAILVLQA